MDRRSSRRAHALAREIEIERKQMRDAMFYFVQKLKLQLIFLFLLLIFAASPGLATEYYVAKHGSNTNPGTQSLPWRTIAKAAGTMSAGDTVFIAGGSYSERVIPARSGTAGNYITYRSLPGEEAVIDGSVVSLPNYDSGLIEIFQKSHIKISGLHIRNAGPHMNNAGIYVNYSESIIIENNRIYNTVSSGIAVWDSTNVTVDGNEVELACNDGEQECITIASTNGFTVSRNHVHHNGPGSWGGEGIDAKDGSSNGRIFGNTVHDLNRLGIYVEAWDKHTHTIQVYNNRVYNCGNDGITLSSEMGGLLENIYVFNNLVYKNRYNGISITPNGEVAAPPMRNLYVINNTIHQNGDSTQQNPWGGGIFVDGPNIKNMHVRNNVVSQNLFYQILLETAVSGISIDHNLIDGFRGFENEVKGSPVIEAAPGFVNTTVKNYHLAFDSPAIDRGSPLNAPEEDFDGIPRPQGTRFDIGAYEYPSQEAHSLPGILMLLNKNSGKALYTR